MTLAPGILTQAFNLGRGEGAHNLSPMPAESICIRIARSNPDYPLRWNDGDILKAEYSSGYAIGMGSK